MGALEVAAFGEVQSDEEGLEVVHGPAVDRGCRRKKALKGIEDWKGFTHSQRSLG
jgi:hypothetical protein